MKSKTIIVVIVVGLISFTAGFFIGDSVAINRVKKAINTNMVFNSKSNIPAVVTKKEDQSQEKQETEKVYNLGDTIQIGDKYTVTINKVYLTKDRNQFSDKKVEKVAVIEYSYKNIGLDEDLYISEMNFKVYDEEGNVLETYPAGANKMPQNIAKGKQCTAEMSYGYNKGDKLELHFYANMFNDKADAKIVIQVQ